MKTLKNEKVRILGNENGIALVMVLILSLISLAMVSALIYMITQSTRISGHQRIYRSAEEAAKGALDIPTSGPKESGRIPDIPMINNAGNPFVLGCQCNYSIMLPDGRIPDPTKNIDLDAGWVRTCRCDKICNATVDWDSSCDEGGGEISLDPVNPLFLANGKYASDMVFELPLPPAAPQYRIFAKIINTVKGNSFKGSGPGLLYGRGVDEPKGTLSPPHNPYLHRIEMLAESITDPTDHSRFSILYAD